MPPRIVVLKQLDQLGARFLAQVAWWHAFGAGRLNLVNPAVSHVPTIGIGLMTGILVMPINDVNGAVGPPAHIDRPKILVTTLEKIGSVLGHEGRAVPFQDVPLDHGAMNAAHEQATLEFGRYLIALEHERACMSPATLRMMGMVADFFQKSVGVGVAVTIRSADLTNVRPAP